MFILNLNKEPHLESNSHQVMGFIPTTNIGCNSNLKHLVVYETILVNRQTWHSSLERD